jgi:hypothetical protein
MKNEIATASAKAAPPVAITATHYLLGIPLSEWVSIFTIAYIVLQGFLLIRNQIRKEREGDK